MARRIPVLLATLLMAVLGQAPAAGGAAGSAPPARAQLRVDQAGYGTAEAKSATLMTSVPAAGVRYRILHGARVVAAGRVPSPDRGGWNATYRHTYGVPLPGLHRAGTYRLVVDSRPRVQALIRVRSAAAIYREVLTDGVRFDQVQRDGRSVIPGALRRRPSHLNDARAAVYETPQFDPATDEITDPGLTATGRRIDASGGWFDAGDYLKFTHTAAFADVVLLSAQRGLGRAAPGALVREGRFGLDWLSRMWHPATKTLYLQVGIGNGTSNGRYLGDHDLWRLPERDDADRTPADRYATAARPVFAAAPDGAPISPNLAGRVAAAFALAAQVDSGRRAVWDYEQAVTILGLADTSAPPDPLTTALPNDFYPESTWRDDMELATAEAALAAERLHRSPQHWLEQSAHWARGYLDTERGDTFNLYDVSALAHVELATAMARAHAGGLAVDRATLVADLARQLGGAAQHARHDPFRAAGNVTEFDVDAHTFGVIATAGWYHRLTGSSRYDGLATAERHWLFGGNAWGVSFMVGVGRTFPHCMQHQVANLRGSTDGSPPLAVGAVVNGPNGADLFAGGLDGFQDGMRHCTVAGYAQFDGHGSRYLDDVRSWQTDEPALDMTGAAIIAAAAWLG